MSSTQTNYWKMLSCYALEASRSHVIKRYIKTVFIAVVYVCFSAENPQFSVFRLFIVIKNVILCLDSNDNICGSTLIESDLIEWFLIPTGIWRFSNPFFLHSLAISTCWSSTKLSKLLNLFNQFCNLSYMKTDYESEQNAGFCCLILNNVV